MKPRGRIPLAIALLLLAFGIWWGGNPADSSPEPPASPADVQEQPRGEATGTVAAEPGPLVVRNVIVRDTDGRIAWRGDVDLAPALERIEQGVKDPHRNDGGVFGNREVRLPARERGYYREYVVRTPGISHAGPQRLIMGRGGEVYYTSDHYESFRRIR